VADQLPSIFADESEDMIFARLIADLPAGPPPTGYNTRAGSALYALFRPLAVQRLRLMDAAEEALRQSFLLTAEGSYLDLRALESGVTRGAAVAATCMFTVTVDWGAIPHTTVSIPQGSTASTAGDAEAGTDGIEFATIDTLVIAYPATTGTVGARASLEGEEGNVAAGTVLVLSAFPSYVVGVTNTDATGGVDEESDEELRQTALERARTFPESGNAATYRILALQDAEVSLVTVQDQWLGPGTVAVSVAGETLPYVSSACVKRLQQEFDPSILPLCFMEDETWSLGTVITASPLEGKASQQLTAGASTTQTMDLALSPVVDISPWKSTSDEYWLYIRTPTTADRTNIANIKLVLLDGLGGTATATLTSTELNPNATALESTSGCRQVILRSFFVVAGGFNWTRIATVRISLTAGAGGTSNVQFDTLRLRSAVGGFGGVVPLGNQVTVRSARGFTVNIAATIVYDPGATVAGVTPVITQGLNTLLTEVGPGGVLRLTDVGNVIHDTPGVLDYSGVLIAGAATNMTLPLEQRPILGTLTLS
jgi:uncharacterized phage protein gp47/JayE